MIRLLVAGYALIVASVLFGLIGSLMFGATAPIGLPGLVFFGALLLGGVALIVAGFVAMFRE